MTIDIVYLAWNRIEYTTATWAWLIAHTNWEWVNRLIVYDDGSEDGTQEFLRDAVQDTPVDAELRVGDFRSPPAVMNHYLATSEAEVFAKIDNDIALPGGWLDQMATLFKKNRHVHALGMEAGMVALQGRDGHTWKQGIADSSHIGGVGLIRASHLRALPRIPERGRFGWTEFQNRYRLRTGWIVPDLLVPQLDRVPAEPWASLAERYVEEGWSREWPKYDPRWMAPYYEWTLPAEVPA